MSDEGERIAHLEALIISNTKSIEALTRTVADVVVFKRDIDYHRRDIDMLRNDLNGIGSRTNALEGKELFNRYARWAIFAAALALISMAWDSIRYTAVAIRQELPEIKKGDEK